MKKLVLVLSLFGSVASAQVVTSVPTGGIDIDVRTDKFSLTVRGSGDYVCSALESFSEALFLGRGETRLEAQENARSLAAAVTGKDGMFIKPQSCERSASGNGRIGVITHGGSATIVVEGPSKVICYSKGSFDNLSYIAKAATGTEASALARAACMSATGKNGMFCTTTCEKVSKGKVSFPFPFN